MTAMKKIYKGLAIISALSVLHGCVNVPVIKPGDADYDRIVQFQPSDDKGVLYVYRDVGSHYGLFQLELQIEGKEDIVTSPSSFVRIELEPGNYQLEADHPDIFGFEDELDLVFAAGETRYLEFKPVARFIVPGSSYLLEVDEAAAQDKIRTQNLVPRTTEYR
ncbi:hypothetical protein [Allohahella sp. A8]|uniref:hypothetical protein n=1 Tax=Allohahella sp. A8 TaxID=3141461 RepID=UPI000C0BABDE|nr:hypothetical protein [Hahellaceae bacterium]